ncbi:hypothetical protein COBT_000659 [Conglomerata obtusa]
MQSKNIAYRDHVLTQRNYEGISDENFKKLTCAHAKSNSFKMYFWRQYEFIRNILHLKSTHGLDDDQLSHYKNNDYDDCLDVPAEFYGKRMNQKAACNESEYSPDIDDKNEWNFYKCIETKNLETKKTLVIDYPPLDNVEVKLE